VAALAVRARDRGWPRIQRQVLILAGGGDDRPVRRNSPRTILVTPGDPPFAPAGLAEPVLADVAGSLREALSR
jgi:hypothetical protein